ncbi:MAG: prolyl-tRNA synthetase associated domain-containing protein [Emcibacter sp.]|nr:prolyl-tRNA synthetase associated domain-containing protein [Emcibacter sp.]
MYASERDLFNCFEKLGIKTTTYRHLPLYSVAESQALRGNISGGHCKSLFLKDKKSQYLLAIIDENRTLDIKALSKSDRLGVNRLSFASEERLMDVLGVKAGSVTPFSLINLKNESLKVLLDNKMMENNYLNFHPLHNEATTTISNADLIKFIRHFNIDPIVMDFDNL